MSRRAHFDRREILVGGALATLAAAEAAARPIGAHGVAALSQGVPVPPPGYAFVLAFDGAPLTAPDGAYYTTPAS